jgi:hypothetical protein
VSSELLENSRDLRLLCLLLPAAKPDIVFATHSKQQNTT